VTIPCHQPETCVELDVNHVATCTWCWCSPEYRELLAVCVGSIQQFLLLCLPPSERGRTLLMLMQWVEVHQLGPMDETPGTPKMTVVNRTTKNSIIFI
jgi:hypothetical protein